MIGVELEPDTLGLQVDCLILISTFCCMHETQVHSNQLETILVLYVQTMKTNLRARQAFKPTTYIYQHIDILVHASSTWSIMEKQAVYQWYFKYVSEKEGQSSLIKVLLSKVVPARCYAFTIK